MKSYLVNLFYGQNSNMNNDLLLVIVPLLSITVLMFGLRALFLDFSKTRLQK